MYSVMNMIGIAGMGRTQKEVAKLEKAVGKFPGMGESKQRTFFSACQFTSGFMAVQIVTKAKIVPGP